MSLRLLEDRRAIIFSFASRDRKKSLLYLTLASILERFIVHEIEQEFTEKHEGHIVTLPTKNAMSCDPPRKNVGHEPLVKSFFST